MSLSLTRSCLSGLLVLSALTAGCNDLLGIGEPVEATTGGGGATSSTDTTDTTTATSSDGGGGASTGSGGSGGGGGSTTSSSSTAPPCESPVTEVVNVAEDGPIFPGACNGAISPGAEKFANVGLGRGLFRFALPAAVALAFAEDRVIDLKLSLFRAPECGDGPPCTVKKPGPFEARPLRNDWQEGNGSGYSGADWCRRLAGNPAAQWSVQGADGDEDRGDVSGTTSIADADMELVMPLDPAIHKPRIGTWAGAQSLSVRIARTDASAVFVCATHEANDPATLPRLTVTYCPP